MKKEIVYPFVVPPFSVKPKPIRYVWWSWHPLYNWWSKSCWGAPTIEEALELLDKDACGLDYYHNKLIMEGEDGSLIEVYDAPCKRLDIWEKIYENMKAGLYDKH